MSDTMTTCQKKEAARELCRLRGIDPDACEPFNGHNQGTAGVPAWKLALLEIEAQELLMEAIRVGKSLPSNC